MITLQTPAPWPPNYVPPPSWGFYYLAALGLVVVGAWLLMPLIRAWAKRIEGRAVDPDLAEEIARMRDRIAELELSVMRTQELEERLDFAERLLAQRSDQAQLPRHQTPV
jgi:hypothetical protein